MKLISVGDLHLRGTNPRNRIDDYVETSKAKLLEVFDIAREHKAKAIIIPGDVWDRPEVAISVLLDYAKVLAQSPCDILTTPGNHDIYGYNVETYWRSSLRLLEIIVPQLKVSLDPSKLIRLENKPGLMNLTITFTPYSSKMDMDGYGYCPEVFPQPKHIHVAHGMALDHVPPFDRYSLIQHIKTTADLVITGHDHTGYGLYRRADGKIFMNFGALMRISASVNEIERQIQVAVIELTDQGVFEITPVPLKSAKPGPEVLDRSRIESEKQRKYTMDNFSALIQQNTGQAVLLDVNQIVEAMAKQDNIAPDIVALTLAKIDQMREVAN